MLQALQLSVHADRPTATIKTMLRKCPCCITGTPETIDVFEKRGPPQKYFTGQQNAPVARQWVRESLCPQENYTDTTLCS